jgi:hypothetical protein
MISVAVWQIVVTASDVLRTAETVKDLPDMLIE